MGRRLGAALALAVFACGVDDAAADVAVIVHPGNPEVDLSRSEVERIFKQERQHWRAGRRIYLILQETGTLEKDVVLRRLYRMTDAELKQFWLGKLYRGEISSFPRVVPSNAAVARIVAHAPNAVGFVNASAVDASVKVLRIDGRRPGEPGYLLGARGSGE